jgi:hypothetical protein
LGREVLGGGEVPRKKINRHVESPDPQPAKAGIEERHRYTAKKKKRELNEKKEKKKKRKKGEKEARKKQRKKKGKTLFQKKKKEKKVEVRAGLYPLGLEPRDTTPHVGVR